MNRFPAPMRARGFSLIEVLVATVVLSVGLLGLASLQVSGLRVGQSSFYRAQAAQLATDMADRLRARRGPANWRLPTPRPAARRTPASGISPSGAASCAPCRAATAPSRWTSPRTW